MSKLALLKVSRRFGDVAAVLDVTLDLAAGEFLSLLGPSGCGKTTTLRMIAGFVPPSTGRIEMDGRTISEPGAVLLPEKRRMSMIFQNYALWPNMTVAENVAFGLEVRKLARAEIERRVDRMLDVVRLRDMKDRYPSTLSGGQQQRVALARAIVVEPEVLLLDEPLSNLDTGLREEMRTEIRRLHDAFRITTVYVTHDQGEAMVASDRIAVMNEGRIEQVDTPQLLYARPANRFVASFVGRTNFLTGRKQGGTVAFDGFAIAAALLERPDEGAPLVYSLRPPSIELRLDPGSGSGVRIEAEIASRAYLGEYWDYQARPVGGGLTLRLAAPPRTAVEVGRRVWLEIDPAAMVRVE
ncbi:MAG: ABC transporter ATP-binding protein [Alphaproteobacteria bacterium]|nr:ABC transporter ATP-binding protein [Alphaproteobacteria bacterium]